MTALREPPLKSISLIPRRPRQAAYDAERVGSDAFGPQKIGAPGTWEGAGLS